MYAVRDLNGVLQWVPSQPVPEIEELSVRIRVAATAVNRADLVQRKGHYPPPPGVTDILGLECSGEVVEVGALVDQVKVGDRVCALLSGGGYAEEVVVPAGQVLKVPSGYSMLEAAALPEVFATAWLNLCEEGMLASGERVLVHAGASGVGTAVVQLCVAWGNPVVVTLGSDEKAKRVLELGAEAALNRHDADMMEQLAKSGGFDVIIDPVGGRYLEKNIQLLNPQGRLVNIGLMGGSQGRLPLAALLTKRLTIKGSVLRSRSPLEKGRIVDGLRKNVWPLLEARRVVPIVDAIFSISDVESAHARVADNENIGKVVLTVERSPNSRHSAKL